jgi:hypothetical protein
MHKTILLTLLLFHPLAAYAEVSCKATDTVNACFTSTFNETLGTLRPQALAAAKDLVQRQEQAKPTGPVAPDTAIGSATNDFLSRFIASLQSAQLDQKKGQLSFAYNVPAQILGSSVKVQTVFYRPEVLGKLQDALTAAGKTKDLSALQSKLNDADDVSVTLSAAPETMRLGRSFKPHREEFEALYKAAVLDRIDSSRNAKLRDNVQQVLQRYSSRFPPKVDIDIDGTPIGKVVEIEPKFVSILQAAARSAAELEAERDRLFGESYIASFADLLANQPQLSFSVGGRWRDRTVGANEVSAHASYEMGFVNLNRACPGGPCTPGLFKTYVENNLRSLQADNSDKTGSNDNRFTLTIDYRRTQTYAFSLPADDIDLKMPRATHWTYGMSYGRQLVFDKAGKPLGRIDLTGKYENFSDDPLHQDRGTLDLTYTQKVSDTFSLPLGVSYANHGEFLGQVDRRLSAHFGLHASVFGKDQ